MAKLDAAGIVVKDMATALAFYRLLGLEIPAEADGEAHAEHATPGGFRLMWDTVDLVEGFDAGYERKVGNSIALALLCDSPQEVDERYNAAVAAGHEGHREPWDAFWGQRYATLRDPDGHLVDLFAPLEATDT